MLALASVTRAPFHAETAVTIIAPGSIPSAHRWRWQRG